MLAILASLCGCAEKVPGPPELTRIEPPLVQVGYKYPYEVFGAHFRDRVVRHTEGDRALSLDQGYTVWVRLSGSLESEPGTSLGATRKKDDQTLEVTGEPLATVGKYDLQVKGPYGQSEWLSAKLEVVGAADCALGVPAPLAGRQDGVCAGRVKICQPGVGWVEPDYATIPGYETTETTCDGKDNDCNGQIDDGLTAPAATRQAGVCAGQKKVCQGTIGWADPNYAGIPGYEANETSLGDGLDNDCDGLTDVPGLGWTSIPGGSYQMGSTSMSEEQPLHAVTVTAFEMTKTEVTVKQYRACTEVSECSVPGTAGGCNYGVSGKDGGPVNCVTWDQAVAFCKWAGGRLPSEAEWEYAARGGGQSMTYPWGEQAASCAYAVMSAGGDGCGTGEAMAVCSKAAGNTTQQLCDMIGNVFEWVQDWYHGSYAGAPANGVPWETPAGSDRVVRGSSYVIVDSFYLRAAYRAHANPGLVGFDLGIRCAR